MSQESALGRELHEAVANVIRELPQVALAIGRLVMDILTAGLVTIFVAIIGMEIAEN